MTATVIALAWLVASILLAPLVGRAIRAGHDRDACPTCQQRATDARLRHPSRPDPTLAGAYVRPANGGEWRCLLCPGAPSVDDPRTHSALVHAPRVLAPEDDPTYWRTTP